MNILRVAVAVPLRRVFDYLLPETVGVEQATLPPVGVRVKVGFGPKELIGILVELDHQSEVAEDKLKPALAILDDQPIYSEQMLGLARWAADYYQHPIGEALAQALPTRLRKGEPLINEKVCYWRIAPDISKKIAIDKIGARSKKQRELYEWLSQSATGTAASDMKLVGFSKAQLDGLIDKSLVVEEWLDQPPWIQPSCIAQVTREPCLQLNDEQEQALASINQAQGFAPILLEGVTGSGKTEVYLQAISECLLLGQQALVLVPEIGLTPQTIARFNQRFSVPMVALHSNLTEKQRQLAWQQAGAGTARIVIGTRSAIFTSLPELGIIIVDEEHDSSFKQQDGYRYHARDLALVRGQREGVPVVLGTATPSLETLHNALSKRFHHLSLTQRAGAGESVSFETVNVRGESLRCGVSDKVEQAIDATLMAGDQALVFLNRRGFSPALSCDDCGWLAECTRCDARMTLHKKPPHLHCHHCDSQTGIPRFCPTCGSSKLKPTGVGTERAEDFLRERYSHVPIHRVDRDTTSRKQAMQTIVDEVNQGEPCILVGTQMLAKGHHFPKVTLVVILDADAGLFSADFRGMEKTAQLLLQVSGRAGRENNRGKVLVQTAYPDHPTLQCLFEQGYGAFATKELETRRFADMPPYRFLALLRVEASVPGRAEAFLQTVRTEFENAFAVSQQLFCIGPLPAPMVKRAGHFRAQLQVNGVNRGAIQAACKALVAQVERHPQKSRVRWSLDIDPVDIY